MLTASLVLRLVLVYTFARRGLSLYFDFLLSSAAIRGLVPPHGYCHAVRDQAKCMMVNLAIQSIINNNDLSKRSQRRVNVDVVVPPSGERSGLSLRD